MSNVMKGGLSREQAGHIESMLGSLKAGKQVRLPEIGNGDAGYKIPGTSTRRKILWRSKQPEPGMVRHLYELEKAEAAARESEAAAHQSEERMRRYMADASQELRMPLTAIRGFAEYYRQRGGLVSRRDKDEVGNRPDRDGRRAYAQ